MAEPIPDSRLAPKSGLRKIGVVIFIGIMIVGVGANFAVDYMFESETRGLRRIIALFLTGFIVLPAGAIAYAAWGPATFKSLLMAFKPLSPRGHVDSREPQ